MAISPPESKIWWNDPVEKSEVVWVSIALTWALIMFFMMPLWHMVGSQNMSNEAYRISPDKYWDKAEAFAAKYKVGEENGVPVVAPPPGSDVYIVARKWDWYPVLKLEKGQKYRVHMSSMDWMHGFSLQPANINLQVHPGIEMVVTLTPTWTTPDNIFGIVCNEFCGDGHHMMLGRLYVTDKK
jgi:cytochrome c oxidase subunit 2